MGRGVALSRGWVEVWLCRRGFEGGTWAEGWH